MKRLFFTSALLAGLLQFQPALAQDVATAEALFREGRDLMDAGKIDAACAKFAQSQQLDPSSGTAINLAACHEKQGKTATAWAEYLVAARLARAQQNAERAEAATRRATALEKDISYLTVQLTEAVPGVTVRKDKVRLDSSAVGARLPIDPGEHTLEVSAPGYRALTLHVTIASTKDDKQLSVPRLEKESGAAAASSGETPGGAQSPQSESPTTAPVAPAATPGATDQSMHASSDGLGTQRALALVAAGAGVVGVAVGSVFGLESMSKHDEAARYCDGARCTDPRGVSASKDAIAAGNVSTIAFAVGAAGLAGGAILWFTAKPAGQRTESAQVGVGIGRVEIRGAW